jgi:hypothetical protein
MWPSRSAFKDLSCPGPDDCVHVLPHCLFSRESHEDIPAKQPVHPKEPSTNATSASADGRANTKRAKLNPPEATVSHARRETNYGVQGQDSGERPPGKDSPFHRDSPHKSLGDPSTAGDRILKTTTKTVSPPPIGARAAQ